MEIALIPIGNSKGIRLSKTVIEKYQFQDTIELIMEKDFIILKPKQTPRKNWAKVFKKMSNKQDDKLIIPDDFNDETFEEWK